MAGELKALRAALLTCKDTNGTFTGVTQCAVDALKATKQAVLASPATKLLFSCEPDQKELTAFLVDVAEIANIGSFDMEDIKSAKPLFCAAVDGRETSIDRIDLKRGATYLIKHSGTNGDPVADAAAFVEPQLVGQVLGEDLPQFIWSNPRKGRFAMMWFPHRRWDVEYQKVPPHEMVTSLIFEVLLGDADRHAANVVTLRDALIGHLDFGAWGILSPTFPPGGRGASPALGMFLNALRSLRYDVDADYPGFKQALAEGIQRWSGNWRKVLSRLSLRMTAPERLAMVDNELNDLAKQVRIPDRVQCDMAGLRLFDPAGQVKTPLGTIPIGGTALTPPQQAALRTAQDLLAEARQLLDEHGKQLPERVRSDVQADIQALSADLGKIDFQVSLGELKNVSIGPLRDAADELRLIIRRMRTTLKLPELVEKLDVAVAKRPVAKKPAGEAVALVRALENLEKALGQAVQDIGVANDLLREVALPVNDAASVLLATRASRLATLRDKARVIVDRPDKRGVRGDEVQALTALLVRQGELVAEGVRLFKERVEEVALAKRPKPQLGARARMAQINAGIAQQQQRVKTQHVVISAPVPSPSLRQRPIVAQRSPRIARGNVVRAMIDAKNDLQGLAAVARVRMQRAGTATRELGLLDQFKGQLRKAEDVLVLLGHPRPAGFFNDPSNVARAQAAVAEAQDIGRALAANVDRLWPTARRRH